MESVGCSVCGTQFSDDANDYAGHIADSLFYDECEDGVLESENDWEDHYSMQLADSLFDDVEDDEMDEGWDLGAMVKKKEALFSAKAAAKAKSSAQKMAAMLARKSRGFGSK